MVKIFVKYFFFTNEFMKNNKNDFLMKVEKISFTSDILRHVFKPTMLLQFHHLTPQNFIARNIYLNNI